MSHQNSHDKGPNKASSDSNLFGSLNLIGPILLNKRYFPNQLEIWNWNILLQRKKLVSLVRLKHFSCVCANSLFLLILQDFLPQVILKTNVDEEICVRSGCGNEHHIFGSGFQKFEINIFVEWANDLSPFLDIWLKSLLLRYNSKVESPY